MDNMEDRARVLGFVPQKELIYNKALPYADKLDEESQLFLSKIKANLGNSVLQHEIVPVTMQWITYLSRYIKLYGWKFSKEDHLHFIHLLLELIAIPDLEPVSIQKTASVLSLLLKKRELLSREDLTIAWRPLYEIYERLLFSNFEHYMLISLPANLENSLKLVIRACRPYFSVESTREMLEEWRPKLCLYNNIRCSAVSYFDLFLCTKLPPHQHEHGFKLWLEEFLGLWEKCQNNPPFENSLIWLLSRTARDNIGYIDWEPYIPKIFTKLLRGFNLPGSNSVAFKLSISNEVYPQVVWIVSMLGGGSSCQLHINRLFNALESYYHPSNAGRWVIKLQHVLRKLPEALIARLHQERYKKKSWETPIPEHCHITDAEIREFVINLKPAALLSIFCKFGCADSAFALKNLASLCPDLIVPPVIDRMYSSLETITEPHRLTSVMQCVVAIARSIVRDTANYPEGPMHVVPLLMGALPGVDQNDFRKCIVTFQLVSTFGSLVLFVDASKDASRIPNLSEMQQELCLATAAFEDFILQYMDRCFVLIENSHTNHRLGMDGEHDRMNTEENFLEMGLSTTFTTLLLQSSPEIYKAALTKLHSFVSNRIFEVKVTGKYVANIVRSAAKVCPEMALQTFVPQFSKLILALTENEEVLSEERVDEQLLFSLLLLSEVVRCKGTEVLKYRHEIESVLKRTLHLKCKEGYLFACSLLKHFLRSLTIMIPLEFCSVPDFKNRCKIEDAYSFIKEWGKPGDIHNLGLSYHIPNDEEMKVAQELLDMFLLPELDRLQQWAESKITLTRGEVLCSLHIVLECLTGTEGCLPMLPGEEVCLSEFKTPSFYNPILENGVKELNSADGRNIRLLIYKAIKPVLDYIVVNAEDDVKSVFVIIRIYRTLMFQFGVRKEDFESRWKALQMVKRALKLKLYGGKQHLRPLLADRVCLQHDMRLMKKKPHLTEVHKEMMQDIMKLSVSHYAEVRHRAQSVLQAFLSNDMNCYQWILPDLLQILAKDPNVFHEEFKGALYVVLGNKTNVLLLMPSWNLVRQLWPALISSMHSEKQSIVRLFESITVKILKNFTTNQLELKVPETCFDKARSFWSGSMPVPESKPLENGEIKKAADRLVERCSNHKRMYFELMDTLANILQNGNLHWQHYTIASHMLSILLRYDCQVPAHIVQLFIQQLVHDTVAVRKLALSSLIAVLRLQKRKFIRKEIDPTLVPMDDLPVHPTLKPALENGKRPTNLWRQYNSLMAPTTKEKWDKALFINKTYVGFYCWPKTVKVNVEDEKQLKLNRSREELKEEERPFFDWFSNPEFVDKFIKFLSLEEKKGQEKFDLTGYDFLRGLFRNFGDSLLPLFLNHLERLINDTSESSKRCAAAIIAAIFNGSKCWTFEMLDSLRQKMVPLLRIVFRTMHPEIFSIWSTCITYVCENRDPNRYYWIYELLFEKPHTDESGSFLDASWLYFLHLGLVQQNDRVFELHHRFMTDLFPKMNHCYQNIREKMGRLLAHIHAFDMPLPYGTLVLAVNRADFISSILPKLAILENNVGTAEVNLCTTANDNHSCPGDSDERKEALNFFRTTCRWVISSFSKNFHHAPPEFYQMLPILCTMQSDSIEDELKKESFIAITLLGHAFLSSEGISTALVTLKKIASTDSWHSRVASVLFLKVMVFSNLFSILHNETWLQDIGQLVLGHLHDQRVEVREAAGETLGGLLHCEVLKVNDELLATFKSKCHRKLKRIRASASDEGKGPLQIEPDEMRERHAGILGLCACVNAFPYDVPEFMPDVVVLLGEHLHDPEPIPSTVKKTLSNFRRTHYDNWRDHQLKFSDDQLSAITDLLVSPSYYA